jgi:hypothetical protein
MVDTCVSRYQCKQFVLGVKVLKVKNVCVHNWPTYCKVTQTTAWSVFVADRSWDLIPRMSGEQATNIASNCTIRFKTTIALNVVHYFFKYHPMYTLARPIAPISAGGGDYFIYIHVGMYITT